MAHQQGPNANPNTAIAPPAVVPPVVAVPAVAVPAVAAPAIAPQAAPAAIAPGPDLRAPIHANQVAPVPEVRRASTKNNRTGPADYSYTRSTRVHDVAVWHNPSQARPSIGGLRAGMHLWLRFPYNGTIIQEHLVIRGIRTINRVRYMRFDRIDGNHVQAWFGEYTALGNLLKALAVRCWTNVNTNGMRMMYNWWHVYRHADYAANPINHGQYMGDFGEFRRNFCLRNGWTPA